MRLRALVRSIAAPVLGQRQRGKLRQMAAVKSGLARDRCRRGPATTASRASTKKNRRYVKAVLP
jgi:hypothetical protein